jgi:predicted dienelactone hydrolase
MQRRQVLPAAIALALTGRDVAGADATTAGIVDETWHDAGRARDLPLRLRVPSTPGPWPLLLYSHGLGGGREGGDFWGEAWRAAGLLVLHLQHPGSDTDVLRRSLVGGGGLAGLRSAGNAEQLLARVADVRFVLDEVGRRQRGGQAPWRDLLPGAIGLAGHSFGALTTQAIAGQRYPVAIDLADARPRAFIALSSSMPRGAGAVAAPFEAVTRPFMAVTGSLDGDPFGSFATGESRAAVYDALPPGRRALLWLDGADHMSFAGNASRRIDGSGPFERAALARQRETAHHAVVARVSTLWWRAHLLGDGAAAASLGALSAASAANSASRPEGWGTGDRLRLG